MTATGLHTNLSLAETCARYAVEAPSAKALFFKDRIWSYKELEQDVARLAAALRRSGVKSGDRIAVASTPRPEALLTLLAAMRLGALWVGLNPKYSVREIETILRDCAPSIVFALSEEGLAERARNALTQTGGAAHFIEFNDVTSITAFFEADEQVGLQALDLNAPAVIVYTSGTTGTPKGAVLPHAAFAHCADAVSQALGSSIDPPIRIIVNLPINHVGCLTDMMAPALFSGGELHFMDTFDPAGMAKTVVHQKINLIGAVPTMLQMLIDDANWRRADLSSLKAVGWGGAAISEAALDRLSGLHVHLFTTYGLTEGGSISTTTLPGDDRAKLLTTVGIATNDQELRIAADGAPQPPGQAGEVQIKGRGAMLGYYQTDAATKEAFTDDGWLRTGDIGVLDKENYLKIIGRTSEMFKSGGYNVYPREIENVLEAHPDINAAIIVGAPDDRFQEIGVAYLTPEHGASLNIEDIRGYCADHLANYKIPKLIEVRDRLPLLPIGKVDRKTLKAHALTLVSEASA